MLSTEHSTWVVHRLRHPFRLIFTVSFRVTVCLGLGIGLRSGLGELGLGEMGLGEIGQKVN